MDADDEARKIGAGLHQVCNSRKKSLRVVAELAGMSKDILNRIERGLRYPTLSEVLAPSLACSRSPCQS